MHPGFDFRQTLRSLIMLKDKMKALVSLLAALFRNVHILSRKRREVAVANAVGRAAIAVHTVAHAVIENGVSGVGKLGGVVVAAVFAVIMMLTAGGSSDVGTAEIFCGRQAERPVMFGFVVQLVFVENGKICGYTGTHITHFKTHTR